MAVFPFSYRKVFVGAGPIRTTGSSADLKAGELALIDGETYNALALGATYSSNPVVRLAQGSYRQVDVLGLGHGGGKESIKSRPIEGHYISEWRKANPTRPRNHVVTIGYGADGDTTKDMLVNKDETYKLRITVKGSPVSRFIQHDLYHDFIVTTDCLDACTDPCSQPADPKAVAESFVAQINAHPFISPFVKAEAIFSCDPTNPTVESVAFTLFTLEVCDTGDAAALAEVQRQYPDNDVTRVARNGAISTYEVCTADTDGAPDDFTTENIRIIPDCDTCPTGYTLAEQLFVAEIKRADAGSAGALTTLNGGYTGETSSATVRVSYEFGTSTYLMYFADVADRDAAVASPVTGDLAIAAGSVESACVQDTPTTIAWVEGDARYKTTRTLTVVIGKDCGGDNRLAELEAFFANDTSIVADSLVVSASGDCADTYEVEQYNKECLLDPCSGLDSPTFDTLQSFEGFVWTVVEPELEEGTTCKAGIRLSSAYVETKFGTCSFDPLDFYELEIPLIYVSQVDESGDRCATVWPVTEVQTPKYASGTGEMVKRELIEFMRYRQEYFFTPEGSRMNDTQDVNSWASVIDVNKFYKIYYLVHNVPYRNNHTNLFDQEQYELMVVFEETVDTTDFEQLINGYVTSVGVQLKAV